VTSVIVVICDYAVCCNAEGFYCGNVYKEEELQKCHSRFRSQFPDSSFPSKLSVYGLVKKFGTADFLLRHRTKHNLFFQKKH
jgi:hypothetical protein